MWAGTWEGGYAGDTRVWESSEVVEELWEEIKIEHTGRCLMQA